MQSDSPHVKGLLSYECAVFDLAPLSVLFLTFLRCIRVFTVCCMFDVSFSAKGAITATPVKPVWPQRLNNNSVESCGGISLNVSCPGFSLTQSSNPLSQMQRDSLTLPWFFYFSDNTAVWVSIHRLCLRLQTSPNEAAILKNWLTEWVGTKSVCKDVSSLQSI